MPPATAVSTTPVGSNPSVRPRSAWPTADQILLLHAALDEDAGAAIAAWEEWRRAVDFENLDYGSHRLLPLLHRNLVRAGAPAHPWLARMKGVHRHSWVRNHRLFACVSKLIRELREELGTPVMLLKGAALAMHAYPDPGLRPMDDCDLLVPPEAAPAAMALLERRGWRPVRGWSDTGRPLAEMTALRRRLAHSQDFLSDANPSREAVSVDLHWKTLANAGDNDDLNANLWARAVTVSLPDGTPVLIPDSTELLGQTCLHGLRASRIPAIRWAADATILLRDSAAGRGVASPIDWQRLQRFAVDWALTLRLSAALDFLGETLRAPVPPEISRDLHSHPVSREERAEFRVLVDGAIPLEAGYLGGLLTYYLHRRRSSDDFAGSPLRGLRNAARYLCGVWNLSSPAALPWGAVRYGARRIRCRLRLKMRA